MGESLGEFGGLAVSEGAAVPSMEETEDIVSLWLPRLCFGGRIPCVAEYEDDYCPLFWGMC